MPNKSNKDKKYKNDINNENKDEYIERMRKYLSSTVTEEAKGKLHNTVRYIGIYAGALITIISFLTLIGIRNIAETAVNKIVNEFVNEAVKEVIGTPENPSEYLRFIVEEQVDQSMNIIVVEILSDYSTAMKEVMLRQLDNMNKNLLVHYELEVKEKYKDIEKTITNKKYSNIEEVKADLQSEDWKIRKKAVEELGALNVPGINPDIVKELLIEQRKVEKDSDVLDTIDSILESFGFFKLERSV